MLEELFSKLFPEYVYEANGKPLSPYFDIFESGYEQAEKRIEQLEVQIEKMKCCGNCKQRELIREYGQWKERFNCKGNGCICHSKWEMK